MSKRQQEFQGGGERYGMDDNSRPGDISDAPKQATAAQMARRKIAAARKPSGSQRSSRAGTPTGNAFGMQPGQQSMPSFQPPTEQSGTGFGNNFNFAVTAPSNPFANMNGASNPPAPATGFQFGAQTQQNGGGSVFGNNSASFGSTFGGSNSTQGQQNGFTPSTNIFGASQPSNTDNNTTASTFNPFGKSSTEAARPNGFTPSTATTSSFPSFGKTDAADNPFKGFGQTPQPSQSTPSTSFNFTQGSQQNGDKPASTPFTFGQTNTQPSAAASSSIFTSASQPEQTPKAPANNIFAGFGQTNGAKSAPPTDQTPKPAAVNIFANTSSSGTGLFGSTPTPPPDANPQAPKLGESIFSAMNKKDGITPNMFTSSRDSTPKPAENIFGAPAPSKDAEPTPKPTNMFGGFGASQANGTKPNIFAGTSTSPATAETPKAASNLFSGAFNQQKPETSSKVMFNFGQTQQQDASMTTPGTTPQKQIDTALQQPASAAAPTTKSLFDRTSSRDEVPATAPRPSFAPSTSFFNGPSASNITTESEREKTTAPTSSGGLFDRISPRDPPPVAATKPPTTPNVFSGVPASAAPWLTHGPSALNKQVSQDSPQSSPSISTPKAGVSTTGKDVISDAEKSTLRVLNEGLKKHLATQDADSDLTPIMEFYLVQAAKIRNKPGPTFGAPSVSLTAPSATSTEQKSLPAPPSSALFSCATPKAAAPTAPTQTPKPAAFTGFGNPPQTAPANRKRSADGDSLQIPATEKRARSDAPVEYPRLPDNASETAKLFQASLDKSKGSAPLFQQSTDGAADPKPAEAAKASEPQAIGGFKPPAGFTPVTGGFKPSTGGFTPSTSGFKPPAGMPTFSAPTAGGNNFLAAFGKKANEEEEKARKKRKMEDYDSDEETEEQWAARDKAEQEAKRQKIMAAAKSGAGFTPSDVGTPAPESDDGRGSDRESTPVRSLFDRVTPRDAPATAPSKPSFFGSQTPAASKPTSSLFASKTPSGLSTTSSASSLFSGFSKPHDSIEVPEADKTEAEKEQGTGDNSWKPNTPIKFGGSSSTATESTTPAAPPPAFGNLFGGLSKTSNTDSTGHLNLPKPTFGFNFGGQPTSATNSRATTPGMTTDGEGASTAGEAEDDDESGAASQAEPQVEDQTGLRESEKEHEEVLFTVAMAKGMKWDEKKNDAGEMVMGWADRGKGPLYILKHRDTGKVRVVLKVPPYGVTKMNFAPIKNINYEVVGKGGKMVQGVFVDHLSPGGGSADGDGARKLSKWMIQVGRKEDAEEIAKVLMAERS